jgi:uncharacterized protein YbaR (Trm112 family)
MHPYFPKHFFCFHAVNQCAGTWFACLASVAGTDLPHACTVRPRPSGRTRPLLYSASRNRPAQAAAVNPDRKLLELLVCPVSKAPLVWDATRQELQCRASGLAYPVRDGIPVLLEDQARHLTDTEIDALRP